jgi:hypothetical protein
LLKGEEYFNLIGHAVCRYLSLEGIRKFAERMKGAGINERIWDFICGRLLCEASDRKLTRPRFVYEENPYHYRYLAGHGFEGIIKTLTDECGDNVHQKGIVNISTSGDPNNNRAFEVVNHG